MNDFPVITAQEMLEQSVDIVFNNNKFVVLEGATLNTSAKTGDQLQAGVENTDSGVNKERTVYDATIIIAELDKRLALLQERVLTIYQSEGVTSSLYIVEKGRLLRNMFIQSISDSYTSDGLTLIGVRFMEKFVSKEVEFQNISLTLPPGRKQKKVLSEDFEANKNIWDKIDTIPS